MNDPRDEVVIVTGASGTLGGEITVGLLESGARVVAVGRSKARLKALQVRCGPHADRVELVSLDVTNLGAVRKAIQKVLRRHDRVTTLITGAGNYGTVGDVAKVPPAAWKRALDVNLMGAYNFCHCVLPSMIKGRRGAIVNIAGGGASGPLEHLSSYGVSKAAIVRLTDSIANEVAPYGIRANALLPGPVDSPMQDQLLKAGRNAGHWYEKIKALRDRGEGGVAPARTVELIKFLLHGKGAALSGKLLSARYDLFEHWTASQIDAIAKSPLFSLRRLDPAAVLAIGKEPTLSQIKG